MHSSKNYDSTARNGEETALDSPGSPRAIGAGEGPASADAPRVSVVVTCYNQSEYLEQAIESILAQDYADTEVIVVDDGSTDGTPAVVERYPSVHYVRHENRGLSAARNTGLAHASGDFVVFVDADDWLLDDALKTGARLLQERPECAFVAGAHVQINEHRAPREEEKVPEVDEELYAALLERNVIAMHGAVMYQRNALVAEGGFDESLPAAEDYDLLLRLARRYPTRVHAKPVAAYRKHDNNMSNDPVLMRAAILNVLRRQEKFVRRDEQLKDRYRAGTTFWKRYYGHLQLARIKQDLRRTPDARRKALRDLTTIWKEDPMWMTGRAARAVARRLYRPVERMLPGGAQRALKRWRGRTFQPPVGRARLGDLRRTQPISRQFGYDRGKPVDRYYIETYLASQSEDIRGRVLEIGDDTYTTRFGGDRVTRSDVLHFYEGNPAATFVGDLTAAEHLPANAFDCIVITQTLQLIYDVREAIATLYRILKPGGVVLATFPGISQTTDHIIGDGWYWAFTRHSARRLFEEAFPQAKVKVDAYGNVLAASAFLYGLAAEELDESELDVYDPDYDTILGVRAEKPTHDYAEPMAGRWSYEDAEPSPYDDVTSYRKGLAFLDGHGTIEDWGCGTAYARRFVEHSTYVGIDGSESDHVDHVVDLRMYRSDTDCIFMRHVLEHNYGWREVLMNALASFRKRMTLVIFTPFVDETRQIGTTHGIPDLAFKKEELTAFFDHLPYREEVVVTDTQYRVEHLFYIEKPDGARDSPGGVKRVNGRLEQTER